MDGPQISGIDLWQKRLAHYPSAKLASAHAMFYLNAWLRTDDRSYREVYGLKDIWIKQNQRFLVKGLKVRDEEDDWGYRPPRTLWAHYFEIKGMQFSFHSYIQPKRISKGTSEDLPIYGRELEPKEVKALPLKMPDLLVALEVFLRGKVPKQQMQKAPIGEGQWSGDVLSQVCVSVQAGRDSRDVA